MSTQRLSRAIDYFFREHLSDAQRQELVRRRAVVDVRLGDYQPDDTGAVLVVGGGSRNPDFRLAVGAEALPLQGGIPDPAGRTFAPSGSSVHLLWLQELADVVTDTAEEIQRTMSNLDYYVESPAMGDAAAWARAIAQHPNRQRLTRSLHEYTEVPEAFRALAPSLIAFRHVLAHFFTFDDTGVYYARWRGEGRSAPDDYSLEYRDHNLVELQLERDEVYVYGVVPTRFLDPAAPAGAARFREVVWGFRWGGDDGDTPIGVRVVYTVALHRPNAGDYWDFVCFWARHGVGADIAVSARSAVNADLADFLMHVPTSPTERAAYLRSATQTTDGDTPLLRLLAQIDDGTQLPDGVEALTLQGGTALFTPLERLEALSSLAGVTSLRLPRPVYPRADRARAMVRYDQLTGRIPAAREGGQGAIVGVLDTGIDGNHPSFGSRIVGVWNQGESTGPTPAQRMNRLRFFDSAGVLFRELLFGAGTEYTTPQAIRERARDIDSHGTHVAGIAAGEAVSGANPVPAGMAPKARIVAVQTIPGRPQPITSSPGPATATVGDAMDFDLLTGVAYVIERAREVDANAPVVVNMSLGQHDHAHDGTDVLSRSMNRIAKRNGEYVPGLVLVAAAGNERGDGLHAQLTVPSRAVQQLDFDVHTPPRRSPSECVQTLWFTNPRATGSVLLAGVRVRSRDAPTSVTRMKFQALTHTPSWEHFPALDVHVGITFGPRDPHNNDFEARVIVRSALGYVPDPAGGVTIAGSSYRRVVLEPDWTVRGSSPPRHLYTIPGALLQWVSLNPRWRIEIASVEPAPLTVHAWSARENSRFVAPTDSHLICSPACAESVISVASCNSRRMQLTSGSNTFTVDSNPEGALSSFSSPGPLRSPGTGPGIDITAPGSLLISARSARETNPFGSSLHNAQAVSMQGTSMASPVVAGLIARVLADEPTLTTPQIRQRLQQCRIPTTLADGTTPLSGPSGANDWGAGLIDADKLKPASTP